MSSNDADNVVRLRHPGTPINIGAKPPAFAARADTLPQCGTLIHFPVCPSATASSNQASPARAPRPVMTVASASSQTGWPARPGPDSKPVAPQAVRTAVTRAATQQRDAIERGENEGMRIAPV